MILTQFIKRDYVISICRRGDGSGAVLLDDNQSAGARLQLRSRQTVAYIQAVQATALPSRVSPSLPLFLTL